ncbi:hypothetical protein IG631_16173 [Alternaria alternata]|nr:hypothetical protein IG631_16173 [Alternaria alternata]
MPMQQKSWTGVSAIKDLATDDVGSYICASWSAGLTMCRSHVMNGDACADIGRPCQKSHVACATDVRGGGCACICILDLLYEALHDAYDNQRYIDAHFACYEKDVTSFSEKWSVEDLQERSPPRCSCCLLHRDLSEIAINKCRCYMHVGAYKRLYLSDQAWRPGHPEN